MVSVNFDAYELDSAVFDEMFEDDGSPRPPLVTSTTHSDGFPPLT